MGNIRFPQPLCPGDIIAVTAPSAGIGPELQNRFKFCIDTVCKMGYIVREGACLHSDEITSSSPGARASELMTMLLDDTIAAVIPPWGGEIMIDILPLLDFNALKTARAKWILGYSDLTTFMLPYSLITHTATAHGSNFLELPIRFDHQPLTHWSTILTLMPGACFQQASASRYQVTHEDWSANPFATLFNCTEHAAWKCLRHENDHTYGFTATGRLIGGCLDVVSMLPGSPYGDVNRFVEEAAPEGLLVYLENCDGNTATYCRMLHHLKLAGWFRHANAILLGRSAGPVLRLFTETDAIMSALGDLAIPVVYNMDIGHLPPQMILVNGALAKLSFGLSGHTLKQTLA
jgi:muramoyltetrapeptide carboxypeptidase